MPVDVTVEVYTLLLKEHTKSKGLLGVVSSSAEFEAIPIRRHEVVVLRRIYDRLPAKLEQVDFEAPHFKTFLLLRAHFSRLQLPPDLAADQVLVLEKVLLACVDVMSSSAWLNVLGAMDLSQMCVQSMWETDSPLKLIPHFEPEVHSLDDSRERALASNLRIIEMEDDQRSELLQMGISAERDVAKFVNVHPTLDVSHELVKEEYAAGTPAVLIKVPLLRRDEEDPDDQIVVAPLYPAKKMANWWVAVGEPSMRQLLAIKRVAISKNLRAWPRGGCSASSSKRIVHSVSYLILMVT
ncbi:Sec63 domain-containing protein [Chiua virens]|nr:Sec63 domain-containing protein [Chiua virens]